MRVGIDIGGTFTGVVTADERSGDLVLFKCLTTPEDLSRCFFTALDFAIKELAPECLSVVHGTTVAANALLEHAESPVGMLTTSGFRDVLEIGRHFRRRIYDFFLEKPRVLVPRDLRLEVIERKDASGTTITPLQSGAVRNAARILRDRNIRSVSVCFINSYADGSHEQEARKIFLEEYPDLLVSVSSEVCPEYREFERFSTTCVNAVLRPVVHDYLQQIMDMCGARRLPTQVAIMQSNGGMMTPEDAQAFPVQIVESGPAAGVLAAQYVGALCDELNLIAFDMRGTTAKAGLIRNGRIEMKSEYRVCGGVHGDDSDGYPIKAPAIDLVEVSAGGGSIAWVDSGGRLRVGPQSAGAKPGPVCYSFGGQQPTVTDANLLTGRLEPTYFLGGQMLLAVEQAHHSMRNMVAGPLDLSVEEAAMGILEIANAQMIRALKLITVERGFDPASYSLLASGGAGPLHALALAEALSISKVIIPAVAGGASALGLITANYRHDFSRSFLAPIDEVDLAALTGVFRALKGRAGQTLLQDGVSQRDMEFTYSLDCRYVGQAYEVNVPMSEAHLTHAGLEKLAQSFHKEHERLFSHSHPRDTIEIVLARIAGIGTLQKFKYRTPARKSHASNTESSPAQIYFRGCGWLQARRIHWDDWARGESIEGPALLTREDSTLLVSPGWIAKVDAQGNGVLTQ